MRRPGIVLAAVVAVALVALWPIRIGDCLPPAGDLDCRTGARSLLGFPLGVPWGDARVATAVAAVVIVSGAAVLLRRALADRRTTTALPVAAVALGVLLIAAVATAIGTAGPFFLASTVVVLLGSVLIGAGAAGLVRIAAGRRGVAGRALAGLGLAGTAAIAAGLVLARVPLRPAGSAAYVPLTPSGFSFDWPIASELVLIPALATIGAATLLAALVTGAAAALEGRRRRTS